MTHNLVTIITATHNDGKYLKEAITSVLAQTYSYFEFIVVNDASSDNTEEILEGFAKTDKRIVVLTNKKKLGLSVCLNMGIKRAKGTYIARIDSDDTWTQTDKLEKQVAFLDKNPDYGLVGTWAYVINTKGTLLSKLQYPLTDSDIRSYFLFENCFIHSSALFRQSNLIYNEKYNYAQDYDLWLAIGEKMKVANIPLYMVSYRKNPNGMSQKNYKAQIKETIHIIKKYTSSYPHASLAFILWYLRFYIPRNIREYISKTARTILFYNSLKTKASYNSI
jgi:glycosyltransferase involved in cell wall biosynthesis